MFRRTISAFASFAILGLLSSCTGTRPEPVATFETIFDGKSLEGWRAIPEDSASDWSASDGVLLAEGSQKRLAYLVYEDEHLRDFELKFSYRMLTDGNSGIELRAHPDPSGKRPLEGYHADFGHVGIGPAILGAWDFHFATRREFPCERGKRLVIDASGQAHYTDIRNAVALTDIKHRDWNEVHIIADGANLQLWLNGKLSSEFVDLLEERLESGLIGLQLHDKGMKVEFKDIQLKRL